MKNSDQRTIPPRDSNSDLPLISIIIPFKDNQEDVIAIEAELRSQTYPQKKMELIFVDNASGRSFRFPEEMMNRHTFLTENDYPQSPYSARNRGVEKANGDVIVFLDANSRPHPKWLQSGIQCLQSTGEKMAAGAVEFYFGEKLTAGKIADALTSIRMMEAVEERQVAYTANLFVNKEVFERAGLFEEGIRSGGDVRFCMKAVRLGFGITYCKEAVVYKKARTTLQLFKKRIRTGKGYYHSWKREKKRSSWVYNLLRSLKPTGLKSTRNVALERYRKEFDRLRPRTLFVLYVVGILEQVSFIIEFFKNRGKD
ncbi:MAG: glycosyltransferase [Bacteroidetes bacterium]|jgi:cellulose synthase/poly-beta-1,6-N-acetylglucosamine synthase-like glycosyltransferase|nr:glycosyltransferase [Bacteroidota bacterium]